MEATLLSTPPGPVLWNEQAVSFYLNAIRLSDYEQRVGGHLRGLVGPTSSLLDIGAGSGSPGAALLAPRATWTTLEPNKLLADYLARRPERPSVHTQRWQALDSLELQPHELVLAANMPGPLDDPERFLDTLTPFVTRAVIWVVPAQRGPKRYCLADFLPSQLHGEDCLPAVNQVLKQLPSGKQPDVVQEVDWTFTGRFPHQRAAQTHFEERFNPSGCQQASKTIRERLEALTGAADGSVDISVPKRSACLIWRRSQ